MLRTAALTFVPAVGLFATAVGASVSRPQATQREILQSRDGLAPTYRSERMRTSVARAPPWRATPIPAWRSAMSRTGRRA